jgi:hypothetical protein
MSNNEKFALVPYDTYIRLIQQSKRPHTGGKLTDDLHPSKAPVQTSTTKAPPPGLPLVREEVGDSETDEDTEVTDITQSKKSNWHSYWQRL